MIDFPHYHPILQASIADLLKGAKPSAFTLTGFEILFLIYPFVQNKKQSWRPALLGITWSIGVFLLFTLIAVGYFSSYQMETMEWISIHLFDPVTLLFIARFDMIVVAGWMMITLSTMILLMWAITQGMKRVYQVPKRITLYVSALIILVISGFINEHNLVMKLNNEINNTAFWVIFVYPLILFPPVKLKKGWRKRRERKKKT